MMVMMIGVVMVQDVKGMMPWSVRPVLTSYPLLLTLPMHLYNS